MQIWWVKEFPFLSEDNISNETCTFDSNVCTPVQMKIHFPSNNFLHGNWPNKVLISESQTTLTTLGNAFLRENPTRFIHLITGMLLVFSPSTLDGRHAFTLFFGRMCANDILWRSHFYSLFAGWGIRLFSLSTHFCNGNKYSELLLFYQTHFWDFWTHTGQSSKKSSYVC